MSADARQVAEWRFGDHPEDGEAWLERPGILHAYLDFRTPESGSWHRVTVCTDVWMAAQLRDARWAFFPAMLVVRQGSPSEMRAQIDDVVRHGWPVLAREATMLPPDYKPADW